MLLLDGEQQIRFHAHDECAFYGESFQRIRNRAAVIGQILARSLLATLVDPFVETATAKGAGRVRIHLRHALPNAVIPALTMVGVLAGNLLAGSVVIETVFSRAGIGRITVAAVNTQDLPVVQGVVVLGALVFVTANLIVDLLYPLLDPRIVVTGKRTIVVGSPA